MNFWFCGLALLFSFATEAQVFNRFRAYEEQNSEGSGQVDNSSRPVRRAQPVTSDESTRAATAPRESTVSVRRAQPVAKSESAVSAPAAHNSSAQSNPTVSQTQSTPVRIRRAQPVVPASAVERSSPAVTDPELSETQPVPTQVVPFSAAKNMSLSTLQNRLAQLAPVSVAGADLYQAGELQKTPPTQPQFTPRQLQLPRAQASLDRCLALVPGQNTFLNAMEAAVKSAMTARKIVTFGEIQKWYELPSVEASLEVSLVSHPLCVPTANSLAELLGENSVPSSETIERYKDFVEKSNQLRREILINSPRALAPFVNHWTQLLGCLGYEESLQTTGETGLGLGGIKTDSEIDNQKNFELAMSTYPSQRSYFLDRRTGVLTKPPGVQFGEDHDGGYFNILKDKREEYINQINQDASVKSLEQRKKLINAFSENLGRELAQKYKAWPVVGTFQFDPNGNMGPCVAQWNSMFAQNSSCRIGNSPASIMTAAATPGQGFSDWCGMQKIIQSFNSQVNTQSLTGVDPSNIVRGQIKDPTERCVSLAARGGTGRIYAHFGPFRNSVRYRPAVPAKVTASGLVLPARPAIAGNMDRLFKCISFATHL